MSDASLSDDHVQLALRLQTLKSKTRSSLIRALDADAIRALVDVALNVLIGTIPVEESQLRALRRRREELLELTSASTSTRRREQLLEDPVLTKEVLNAAVPVVRKWRKSG